MKAYPEPSSRFGEVVCVAGVRLDTDKPEWVRLWPIKDFRDLDVTKKFKKYQVIEVEAKKSAKDPRPESREPNLDSLVSLSELSTAKSWQARRPFVEPLISGSMCEIQADQKNNQTSLGAFRPGEVLDVEVLENTPWTEKQRNALAQLSFLAPVRKQLSWIPYRFKLRYRCDGCKLKEPHSQTIIDWEIKQAYRKWSVDYPDDWRDRIRAKWLNELCGPDKDTAIYVGNQFGAPVAFLVLGIWHAPKQPASQASFL